MKALPSSWDTDQGARGGWGVGGGGKWSGETKTKERSHSRTQVGWVPVQVRSGRQRRVVEPCSSCPCWHWKSIRLPTCRRSRHHTTKCRESTQRKAKRRQACEDQTQSAKREKITKKTASSRCFFSSPPPLCLMIICRRSLFLEAKAHVCDLNRGRQSVKKLTFYKKTHGVSERKRKRPSLLEETFQPRV